MKKNWTTVEIWNVIPISRVLLEIKNILVQKANKSMHTFYQFLVENLSVELIKHHKSSVPNYTHKCP
jgi:hypothetical protein